MTPERELAHYIVAFPTWWIVLQAMPVFVLVTVLAVFARLGKRLRDTATDNRNTSRKVQELIELHTAHERAEFEKSDTTLKALDEVLSALERLEQK